MTGFHPPQPDEEFELLPGRRAEESLGDCHLLVTY